MDLAEPIAIETKLGRVLSGPVPGYDLEESACSVICPSFGSRLTRE